MTSVSHPASHISEKFAIVITSNSPILIIHICGIVYWSDKDNSWPILFIFQEEIRAGRQYL